mmetsp:Transcript_1404/g.3616  ORF Transcript_1404/g.3616 Transcript_1404/m.3616 type:complete len:226 (-) Transcript_1404:68-745(-)
MLIMAQQCYRPVAGALHGKPYGGSRDHATARTRAQRIPCRVAHTNAPATSSKRAAGVKRRWGDGPAIGRTGSASWVAASGADEAAPVFHLAFPVRDLSEAKVFYGGKLGLQEGRSAATWVDYSLYGHQIVCHEVKGYSAATSANDVDGDPVPVPHMGLAMSKGQFDELAVRVREAGIQFIIEPHLRFQGQAGEQWTMFFKDPSGNALEFKAMSHPENLFAKYYVE